MLHFTPFNRIWCQKFQQSSREVAASSTASGQIMKQCSFSPWYLDWWGEVVNGSIRAFVPPSDKSQNVTEIKPVTQEKSPAEDAMLETTSHICLSKSRWGLMTYEGLEGWSYLIGGYSQSQCPPTLLWGTRGLSKTRCRDRKLKMGYLSWPPSRCFNVAAALFLLSL